MLQTMILYLVADYGVGDLAFAEVSGRLHAAWESTTIDWPQEQEQLTIVPISVAPFDTVSAGFMVAQLALAPGPKSRMVFHNVAPRRDDPAGRADNSGEPLAAGQANNGTWVVGPASGHIFTLVRPALSGLYTMAGVDNHGSQFRSRDMYPQAIINLLAAYWNGHLQDCLGEPVKTPTVAELDSQVLYTDGYGNMKTSLDASQLVAGNKVHIGIAPPGQEPQEWQEVVVADGTFHVPDGTLTLAPGSSGWRDNSYQQSFYELFLRGGSAAKQFGFPPAGSVIHVNTAATDG